jgi:DUF1365 family protein
LRAYAQRCAAERGIDLTGGRVLLLCDPRLLGYTFNPLSVYFCTRADGTLALLIYEVRNTFGDIHAYALAVNPGEISAAGVRQQQEKLLYVSPFIEMAMRYHFQVSPPANDVKLRFDHGGAVTLIFLAAARHLQDRRGDPLGSFAALAQRRASGATGACRTCESCLQYRLGDWQAR